jgi:hypothetical protein
MMPLMWNTSNRPHTSDLANSVDACCVVAPTEKQSAAEERSYHFLFVLLQFELPRLFTGEEQMLRDAPHASACVERREMLFANSWSYRVPFPAPGVLVM